VGLLVRGLRTRVCFSPRGIQTAAEMGITDQAERDLARRAVPVTSGNQSRTTLTYSVSRYAGLRQADGILALDWSGDWLRSVVADGVYSIGNPNCLCVGISGTIGDVRITRMEIAPPVAVLPTYSRVDLLAQYEPASGENVGLRYEEGNLSLLQSLSNSASRWRRFGFLGRRSIPCRLVR